MTTVKKTHWFRITLIVLIVCGIAGIIWAAVQFSAEFKTITVSSSIQFSFEGAAEGKAPNGYPFDLNGITSDEVIAEALADVGLQDTYTLDQIRQSLTVTGVYPKKILEQMTRYVSLLDKDADTQAIISDFHATVYKVSLSNQFDLDISSTILTELLGKILNAYRAYFSKMYAAVPMQDYPVDKLKNYDYAQQLDIITEISSQQQRYAEEMNEQSAEFKLNGKSFGDIAVAYQNLESDIKRLDAEITLSVVSKDRERLQKRYELEIRNQDNQLASLKTELKQIEAQVDAYEKEGIIYVSSSGSLHEVGGNASDTYDKLVEKRKELTDSIAATNAIIAMYQDRLEDIIGNNSPEESNVQNEEPSIETEQVVVSEQTEEEIAQLNATMERKIQILLDKENAIKLEFVSLLDAYSIQNINENTIFISDVKNTTPSFFSGTFVIKAIKIAGPICAVGFMVCVVLLIISRRKEEKQAA